MFGGFAEGMLLRYGSSFFGSPAGGVGDFWELAYLLSQAVSKGLEAECAYELLAVVGWVGDSAYPCVEQELLLDGECVACIELWAHAKLRAGEVAVLVH